MGFVFQHEAPQTPLSPSKLERPSTSSENSPSTLDKSVSLSPASTVLSTPVVPSYENISRTGSSKASEVKVGIAIVSSEEKSNELEQELLSAMNADGAQSKVCKVSSALQLPAAHMQLAKSGHCDVVIAVFAMEGPMAHMMIPSVIQGLMQKAATTGIPCVHGLYHPSDVDVKALTRTWANDVTSLTNLHRETSSKLKDGSSSSKDNAMKTLADTNMTVNDAVATGVPRVVAESMKSLKETLKQHGARGIVGLSRKFKIADDDGSGSLSFEEFDKVIKEHRLGWTSATVRQVFTYFDSDNSGTITYDEFLLGVRGQLNDRRKDMVALAFEVLDKDKSGAVDLSEIMNVYDASKHPDVVSGKKKPGEVRII